MDWEDRAFRSFIRRLAAFATVVRFDKRGTGLSDPVQELPTLEERDADLAAVIAGAGVGRPVPGARDHDRLGPAPVKLRSWDGPQRRRRVASSLT